jgi:2-keto-3-deoxy-L-rhamnonate aldolase RhmA
MDRETMTSKQAFENPVKKLLKEGKRTLGAWLQIGSPMTAEIMSQAGFDWLMVDMEHGPGDLPTLVAQFQAMSSSGVAPFARAPWNDFVIIKRILDAGATGLLVPFVNTREEAEAAVRAAKYPPEGSRGIAALVRAAGYGQQALNYLAHANDEIFVMTQIETPEAVRNLDEMLTVEGLNGIFIGPADLSTNMGHFMDPRHPEVQAAIAAVEAKVLRSGKALGTVSASWEQTRALYEKGYQIVVAMSDGVSLATLAAETVARFHAEFPER